MEQKGSNRRKAPLPWGKPDRKVLWGREFKLVKSGLDVEQVADLVNELLTQSSDTFSSLPEVSMQDTKRATVIIGPEAAEEVQAEAEKIIKKVQENAEEMKRRAEEGENAFAEIRKRAEAMEEEAKRKTLVYLEKAREQIAAETKREYEEARSRFEEETKKEYEEARSRFEEETKKEYKEARSRFEEETKKENEAARSRLYSSIQELINAEQDLEVDLKRKREALMESKFSKLAESMSNLLDVSAVNISDAESDAGVISDVAEEETELTHIERQEKVEESAGEEHEEARTEVEEQSGVTLLEAEAVKTEEPPQETEKLDETLQELDETIQELEGIQTEKPIETQE